MSRIGGDARIGGRHDANRLPVTKSRFKGVAVDDNRLNGAAVEVAEKILKMELAPVTSAPCLRTVMAVAVAGTNAVIAARSRSPECASTLPENTSTPSIDPGASPREGDPHRPAPLPPSLKLRRAAEAPWRKLAGRRARGALLNISPAERAAWPRGTLKVRPRPDDYVSLRMEFPRGGRGNVLTSVHRTIARIPAALSQLRRPIAYLSAGKPFWE